MTPLPPQPPPQPDEWWPDDQLPNDVVLGGPGCPLTAWQLSWHAARYLPPWQDAWIERVEHGLVTTRFEITHHTSWSSTLTLDRHGWAVCTSWHPIYLSRLHRFPGPAVHVVGPAGTRTQHWFDGVRYTRDTARLAISDLNSGSPVDWVQAWHGLGRGKPRQTPVHHWELVCDWRLTLTNAYPGRIR